MTREALEQRKLTLEARLEALVDQLTEADASQATVSSGAGSKSYSNRSVAELERKIRVCRREIARIDAKLGLRPSPGGIRTIYARFDA
jgi:uncharacterized small protein (DUF1192 family)